MFTRIEFFVAETIVSLRRHPAMALAATLCAAAALFVTGLIGLILLNANFAVDSAINRVRFNVYFHPETRREESRLATARIRALEGVDSVVFVPREEAWAEQKRKDPELAEHITRNPLPDKVEVKATDVKAIAGLAKELEEWPEVDEVRTAPGLISKLMDLRDAVGRIGTVVGIILGILALIIIHHTIELTLFARRKEIFIMALVGATPGTVALPFLLEGVAYGLVGGGLAVGCLALLYRLAVVTVRHDYGGHLLQNSPLLTYGIFFILGLGAALGLLGSTVCVIKYLHRPRSKITNA